MFCAFSEYQGSDFYARIGDILAQVQKIDDKLYGLRYTLKTVSDVAFRKTLLAKIEGLELDRATLLKERDALNIELRKIIAEEKVKPKEEQKPIEQMKVEAIIEAESKPVELTEAEVEQVIANKVDPVLKKIEPEILEIVAQNPDNIDYVADLLTEKTLEKVVAEIEQQAIDAEKLPDEAWEIQESPTVQTVQVDTSPVQAGMSVGKIALIGIAVASLFTIFGKKRR